MLPVNALKGKLKKMNPDVGKAAKGTKGPKGKLNKAAKSEIDQGRELMDKEGEGVEGVLENMVGDEGREYNERPSELPKSPLRQSRSNSVSPKSLKNSQKSHHSSRNSSPRSNLND